MHFYRTFIAGTFITLLSQALLLHFYCTFQSQSLQLSQVHFYRRHAMIADLASATASSARMKSRFLCRKRSTCKHFYLQTPLLIPLPGAFCGHRRQRRSLASATPSSTSTASSRAPIAESTGLRCAAGHGCQNCLVNLFLGGLQSKLFNS